MSTPENPPAFPQLLFWPDGKPDINSPGMTLRDYFAAKAMQGMVGAAAFNQPAEDMMKKAGINVAKDTEAFIAMLAYNFADAMLAARNRAGEEGRE